MTWRTLSVNPYAAGLNPDKDVDFLGLALAAQASLGLTDRELRDQVATMFVAGSDTTAGWRKLMVSKNRVESAPCFSLRRLKLKYDTLLSKFAFNFNLRHYTTATTVAWTLHHLAREPEWQQRCRDEVLAALKAGAYTRSHFSST
jgi:cytochrome P450